MTARERSLCDCPEPCACYAADKDKAYFEVIASLDGRGLRLPGKAGLPPGGDGVHGQELVGALRTGRGLGRGGP